MLPDEILLQVRKPSRYLGNEWNVVRKDFCGQKVKFAICFPDLYEIGMSHIGLRIIYGLLNNQDEVVCERIFLPDVDLQKILKEKNIPLFSLESQRPLAEFDFIGFCLNYELDYTNCLAILDLAGIPLESKDRSLESPLIIAGGICTANPEPLADFMDLFLVGEAEEALLEIIDIYKKLHLARYGSSSGRQGSPVTKEGVLRELSRVEGVYVPSFYNIGYDSSGSLARFEPKYPEVRNKIKKRVVKNLDQAFYPTDWIVPYCSIVHDRAGLELMRGCPNKCNFCQASKFYHNLRMRSLGTILELADKICRSTGYEELSLVSLSTSEYPNLLEVVRSLSSKLNGQAVSISLPSLRPSAYLGDLAEHISWVRKTTFTFAPEAGSERIRQLINKNFDMEEFYSAVLSSYRLGWQAVKLYFMIGLPQEEYADLDGILEIAQKTSELKTQVSKYPARVSLSISFFIPKPHTMFEREAMESTELLRQKKSYLIKKSRRLSRFITLSFHNLESSFLEAAFSRGDRSLGKVISEAYSKGCLLDGWSEHFKFATWLEAFRVSRKEASSYLKKSPAGQMLPWQHIDLSTLV